MFFEIFFVIFAIASTTNMWFFWRLLSLNNTWKNNQTVINETQAQMARLAASQSVAALNRASTAFDNISRIDRWDKHQDEELDFIKQRLAMLEEQ